MLLNSGQSQLAAEAMAAEISRIYDEEAIDPFPYEGSRWLKEQFGGLDWFIPDLDLWMSEIAGYCSRGERILRSPAEIVLRVRGVMSLSFFDKHPEYAPLERHITEAETPDLDKSLRLYNRMRRMYVELLDFMLIEQSQGDPSSRATEQ